MLYPKSFDNLIDSFKLLPGIGEKTAERMAFSVLNMPVDVVNEFSRAMIDLKNNIKYCNICGCLSDFDTCLICSDKTRNFDTILVVKDSKDVFTFEKIGNFHGFYHVLGGLISPIDDIGPDDIAIKSLIDRIVNNKVKEVIFAINSGIEADMTILYIKKLLEKYDVSITRIASGIPIGADMDYIDSLTLETALNNRNQVFDNNNI